MSIKRGQLADVHPVKSIIAKGGNRTVAASFDTGRHGGRIRQAVVIGGSLSGLFSAAALAGDGRTVTIVDRDTFPETPVPRRGVPQGSQTHLLLARGLVAAEKLLPGLRQDLIDEGAIAFNGGRLATLTESGWLPTRTDGLDLVTATRPLIEQVVRRRTLALPGVSMVQNARVTGLRRDDVGWALSVNGGYDVKASLVIDASGRGSRLKVWLRELGVQVPEPIEVDARVGYATRTYRADPSFLSGCPGVLIAATPESRRGGLALVAENQQWLVTVIGFGDRRPPKDNDGFERFVSELTDPAIAELVARSEPINDVTIHRQTSNVRNRYERIPDWPNGIIAVGDALCAFNPIYGQGVSVGAMQAEVMLDAMKRNFVLSRTRDLQKAITLKANTAWDIATSADLSFPTCDNRPTIVQAWLQTWTNELGLLAAGGDRRANDYMNRVYNLVLSPAGLFHPSLIISAIRARIIGGRAMAIRPAVLEMPKITT